MKTRFRPVILSITILFVVLGALACQPATPQPTPEPPAAASGSDVIQGRALVENVEILLLESFPLQVRVRATGQLPDGCTEIDTITSEREGNTYNITINTVRPADAVCTEAQVPFTETIPLEVGGLVAGVYNVYVNGVRGSFEFQVDNVLETPAATPTSEETISGQAPPAPGDEAAVAAATSDLARRLEVAPEAVDVVDVEARQWPNSCLGLALPDEACLQVITPGYLITLEVEGQSYLYRSDESGQALRQEVALASAEPPPAPDCNNRVEFVRDVTVRDNARIQPGTQFVKTWRLRNDGSCTWTAAYALVFEDGDQLGGPDVVAFPGEVPPGRTVDLSATLTAPLEKGTYQGNWKLRSAGGEVFGLGNRGARPFWVKIVVPSSITPTPDRSGSAISGRAWHDLCSPPAAGESTGGNVPPGCVQAADGGYIANGVYDQGEPRIAGMEVSLGLGPCPAEGFATTIADATGVYRFENLEAGVYCVSIDILSDHNLPIFIPGAWTHPPGGNGEQTVTVDGVNDVEAVNFGWDYQFAP